MFLSSVHSCEHHYGSVSKKSIFRCTEKRTPLLMLKKRLKRTNQDSVVCNVCGPPSVGGGGGGGVCVCVCASCVCVRCLCV